MKRPLDLLLAGVFAVAVAIIIAASWHRPGLLDREALTVVFFVVGGAFAGVGEGFLLAAAIDPSERNSVSLFLGVFGFPFVLLYALAEGVVPLIGYGASTELFTPLAVLSFLGAALVTCVTQR